MIYLAIKIPRLNENVHEVFSSIDKGNNVHYNNRDIEHLDSNLNNIEYSDDSTIIDF